MSSSTTDTGKPVDPYKEENAEKDTSIKEKVEDLSEFITACKFGMMTTRDGSTGALVSRCMALAAKVIPPFRFSFILCLLAPNIYWKENGGIDLLFHTNTSSGKTSDIKSDPHTNVSFLNSSGEWASISGTSSILTDRATVEKHYSPSLKAWLGDLGDGKHDGGPQDPRIGVIRVETKTATYALVRKSLVGRAKEVAQGMVTGNVASVNKLREISESEIETWRSSNKMVS